uniref:XK-related protein n=1 Tax=Periophthalmus magnuspinnatus TaxID=409849 RepID=A0A3B3ZCI9_9GOBI
LVYPVIYCFVYYLWIGWGPQWLSYIWYLSDGRIRRKSLTWTHILHLGIFKRLWECMRLPDIDVYGEIMQQADVSALRLLEALVVTLPQTLLQTYVLISSVCFAVCVLSLAWALVLYARACSLIRPGHLHMTPAAILCRLLWRVGMLGSRFAVLMLFTRIFKQWILGVIGVHWLGATFWMVSQQTDIIRSTTRWRVFNVVLGAIHVFLFLNVKYGQSRYRMAGFYLVRSTTHLDWHSGNILMDIFCCSGVIALVLYYRFLHPKSFEIFQSIRHRGISGACMERGSSLTLNEKDPASYHRQATLSANILYVGGGTLMDLPHQWEGWRHHHWLLIRLALKTGDIPRIWSAYGEGGLAGLMGEDDFQSAAYGSVTPSSPRAGSLHHGDSNAALTEASSSVASLDIKTPGWSPERRSPLLLTSPERRPVFPVDTTLYFSADAQSPSSGSYLGWGSELSPISSYRSPYRIREARFVTSTPRVEPRPGTESPSPVVVIPATPGTTPGVTPGGTPGTSTPVATTPGASTPGTPIVPLTPVISHARKQIVQFVDSRERMV